MRGHELSSERPGAKPDLVEYVGGNARPVDDKRGRLAPTADRTCEPERVQCCLQGLFLREHGYQVTEGVVHYEETEERETIPLTPDLVQHTEELVAFARATAAAEGDGKVIEALRAAHDYARARGWEIAWGSGAVCGSVGVKVPSICPQSIFPFCSDGALAVNFGWLYGSETAELFRDALQEALATELGALGARQGGSQLPHSRTQAAARPSRTEVGTPKAPAPSRARTK